MQRLIANRVKKPATLAAPDQILVATDLTDTEYLLPHAIAQAHASGAQVTLVHVILPSDIVPAEAGALPSMDEWKDRKSVV